MVSFMRTSLIWRDCYYKFLDIPPNFRNKDLNKINGREDAFWVICEPEEIQDLILPEVKDLGHKELIQKTIRKGLEQAFLISRNGIIQYYPYLSLYNGSLFVRIDDIYFKELKQLKTICLARCEDI
jgi:hypothetical protein